MIKRFREMFNADFARGQLFWRKAPKHHAELLGKEAGYINVGKGKNKTYWQIRCDGKVFKRSRVMFLLAYGHWPTPCVDHKNRDTLDDRPDNLRECDYSQNTINSKDKKRSVPLPRGVQLTKQGRFMARLCNKSLGVFGSAEEAQAVYSKAKQEVFGEFA